MKNNWYSALQIVCHCRQLFNNSPIIAASWGILRHCQKSGQNPQGTAAPPAPGQGGGTSGTGCGSWGGTALLFIGSFWLEETLKMEPNHNLKPALTHVTESLVRVWAQGPLSCLGQSPVLGDREEMGSGHIRGDASPRTLSVSNSSWGRDCPSKGCPVCRDTSGIARPGACPVAPWFRVSF